MTGMIQTVFDASSSFIRVATVFDASSSLQNIDQSCKQSKRPMTVVIVEKHFRAPRSNKPNWTLTVEYYVSLLCFDWIWIGFELDRFPIRAELSRGQIIGLCFWFDLILICFGPDLIWIWLDTVWIWLAVDSAWSEFNLHLIWFWFEFKYRMAWIGPCIVGPFGKLGWGLGPRLSEIELFPRTDYILDMFCSDPWLRAGLVICQCMIVFLWPLLIFSFVYVLCFLYCLYLSSKTGSGNSKLAFPAPIIYSASNTQYSIQCFLLR